VTVHSGQWSSLGGPKRHRDEAGQRSDHDLHVVPEEQMLKLIDEELGSA
jgi:hypothetical protein